MSKERIILTLHELAVITGKLDSIQSAFKGNQDISNGISLTREEDGALTVGYSFYPDVNTINEMRHIEVSYNLDALEDSDETAKD